MDYPFIRLNGYMTSNASSPAAESSPSTHWVGRLAALADPIRLRLLALVEEEELSVSELGESLQLPQSTVSRHLKQLVERGWLVARGERTANFYRLPVDELPEAARALWDSTRAELAGWPELEHDCLRRDRVLAERRRDPRDVFAGIAERWETLRGELYGGRFTEAALAALLSPEWTVADLACGAGDVTVRLAPHVGRVIAVDGSPEMLDAARRRAAGLANVEFRADDLAALTLGDGSCDAALLLLALTHVEEPAAVVAEMARILRPGGRAVVVDLLRHDRDAFRREMGQRRNGFGAEELAALLGSAGFAGVRAAPLAPEPAAKGPALILASGEIPAANR